MRDQAKGSGLGGSSGRGGVWIFDDALDPRSRGAVLSDEQVASQGGHTLVRVGGVGILIPPGDGAVARSVRHFETAQAAEDRGSERDKWGKH